MSLRMWLGAAAEHQRLRQRGPPHQHQRLCLGEMGSFEKGDIVVDGRSRRQLTHSPRGSPPVHSRNAGIGLRREMTLKACI